MLLIGFVLTLSGCSWITNLIAPKPSLLGPNLTLAQKGDRGRPIILCTQFGTISYDTGEDSEETSTQIFIHNEKWLAACGPEGEDDDDS